MNVMIKFVDQIDQVFLIEIDVSVVLIYEYDIWQFWFVCLCQEVFVYL